MYGNINSLTLEEWGFPVEIIISKTVGIIGNENPQRTHLKSKYCIAEDLPFPPLIPRMNSCIFVLHRENAFSFIGH